MKKKKILSSWRNFQFAGMMWGQCSWMWLERKEWTFSLHAWACILAQYVSWIVKQLSGEFIKSSVLVINGSDTYHLHTSLQTGYKQQLLIFVLLRASSCWFVDSSGRVEFDVPCCSKVVFCGIRLERRQYNQNHRRNLADTRVIPKSTSDWLVKINALS